MAKVKGRLTNKKRIGSAVFSKRTIKKIGGDDYTNNVRCVRLRAKRQKRK